VSNLKNLIAKLDNWQRRHRFAGFVYAVIKKSLDDQVNYQSALVTYYGFLALFPLLLVATTVVGIVLRNDVSLQQQVLGSIDKYLPIIGSGLQHNINGFHKTGIALVIGVLLTLYGARGVTSALQSSFNHIWQVPRVRRPGFLKNLLRSFGLLLIVGIGFVLAAALSGTAASLGRSFIFRAISVAVSLIILFATFSFLFKAGTASAKARHRRNFLGAAAAATGIEILQVGGGYLLQHEIQHFGALYGTFAVVLGLLFWIYLQVEVVLYSVEIASVHRLKLAPRGLLASNPTSGDERACHLAANRGKLQKREKITVKLEDG
jgi:YihY family inner membrane protein